MKNKTYNDFAEIWSGHFSSTLWEDTSSCRCLLYYSGHGCPRLCSSSCTDGCCLIAISSNAVSRRDSSPSTPTFTTSPRTQLSSGAAASSASAATSTAPRTVRIGGISAAAARLATEQNTRHSTTTTTTTTTDADSMFLDNMSFSSSMVGSPSGLSSGISHSPNSEHLPTSSHAVASAIPIKTSREHEFLMNPLLSAPIAQDPHYGEFNYVQRRVRKTSMDLEARRVCVNM